MKFRLKIGFIASLIFLLIIIGFSYYYNSSRLMIGILSFLTLFLLLINYLQVNKELKFTAAREKTLKESDNKFRKLAEATFEGIGIFKDGKLIDSNKAFARMLGYQPEDIPGTELVKLVTDQDIPTLQFFFQNGSEMPLEVYMRKKSGGRLPVDLQTRKMEYNGSDVQVLAIQDISKRKLMEEQVLSYLKHLEKVNRELDHFAYIVSHDLKAPLRAINSLALWIAEDINQDNKENVNKNIGLLQGRIQRMEGLINGILDYSKVNKTARNEELVNTRELVDEVLYAISPPPGFVITISNHMPEILTDRVRLQQVFLNLISNAIKYHHSAKGNIHIGYSDQETFCRFFVADDGPGIEPVYHEKIFVIFQKLHARDEVESTGVGLAIVKKIVEDMGGIVELKSELGTGATFYFTWPKKMTERVVS